MVDAAKLGENVPELNVNALRSALLLASLVILIVYVLVEAFCAVTTTDMVFVPTLKAIAPETEPLVTAVPFTVMLALASDLVGVTVMLLVALLTLAV